MATSSLRKMKRLVYLPEIRERTLHGDVHLHGFGEIQF